MEVRLIYIILEFRCEMEERIFVNEKKIKAVGLIVIGKMYTVDCFVVS